VSKKSRFAFPILFTKHPVAGSFPWELCIHIPKEQWSSLAATNVTRVDEFPTAGIHLGIHHDAMVPMEPEGRELSRCLQQIFGGSTPMGMVI